MLGSGMANKQRQIKKAVKDGYRFDQWFTPAKVQSMLSFITLYKPGWKNHSYAAACSVSDKVLWQMLKDHPWLKQVYLCLDSDEAGQTAAKRIAEKLEKNSIQYKILVPKHKDWNEDLLHLRKENA